MKYEFRKSIELALADFDPHYENRCQVYSFGWYKGRVISLGKNDNKTHTLNLRNILKFSDGNIHYSKGRCAELIMFLKLKNKTNIPFNKISVINVRVDKNRNICLSRPCSSCVSLIKYLQPKSLFFTTNSGQFEEYLA